MPPVVADQHDQRKGGARGGAGKILWQAEAGCHAHASWACGAENEQTPATCPRSVDMAPERSQPVCQEYLPAALGDGEIAALIETAVAASGATSVKEMGKVMAILKPQVQGRADVGAVSALVKQRLGP